LLDWHFAVWQPAFAEEKETDMLLHEYQASYELEEVMLQQCLW